MLLVKPVIFLLGDISSVREAGSECTASIPGVCLQTGRYYMLNHNLTSVLSSPGLKAHYSKVFSEPTQLFYLF